MVSKVVKVIVLNLSIGGVSAYLLMHQGASLPVRLVVSTLVTAVLAGGGYAKNSLSLSGALAAIPVGLPTIAASYAFGGLLLSFFVSCSALTRVAGAIKARLEADFKDGGQRDWHQVACNGAVPTALAVAAGVATQWSHVPFLCGASATVTALQAGVLGYYGCCCGDTWASELGILSRGIPRLVTTGRPVRKGTNGGVSLLGLGASAAGGVLMGCVALAFAALGCPAGEAVPEGVWRIAAIGLLAGFAGSIIDSLCGALLQFSGYDTEHERVVNCPGPNVHRISGTDILTNDQVNLVSATITAALTAGLAVRVFVV